MRVVGDADGGLSNAAAGVGAHGVEVPQQDARHALLRLADVAQDLLDEELRHAQTGGARRGFRARRWGSGHRTRGKGGDWRPCRSSCLPIKGPLRW